MMGQPFCIWIWENLDEFSFQSTFCDDIIYIA